MQLEVTELPIIVTFDIHGADPADRNRIQSMFEMFGWQNLGGSSYRYPKLASSPATEDWFNHVIPALMLFRTAVLRRNLQVTKFTIDVQTSTGYEQGGKGTAPLDGQKMTLYESQNKQFGLAKLKQWLKDIPYPY
ncbi:MAG: hypothetical protein AB1725_06470 [Armatimonadota bacterium]